jgi:hypothetical protein
VNGSASRRAAHAAPASADEIDAALREAELVMLRRDERVRRTLERLTRGARLAGFGRVALVLAAGAALWGLRALFRGGRGGSPGVALADRVGPLLPPQWQGVSRLALSLAATAAGQYFAARRARRARAGAPPDVPPP